MADKNNESRQTVEGLDGSEPLDETVGSGLKHPDEGSLNHEDAVADGTTGRHHPPFRSTRPDEPVLGSLAVGAGQHYPTSVTSDEHDTVTGRFIQDEPPKAALQDEKVTRQQQREADEAKRAAEGDNK